MSDIIVREYEERIERIRNGIANIHDIQRTNIEFEVLGRKIEKPITISKLKVPDLVIDIE